MFKFTLLLILLFSSLYGELRILDNTKLFENFTMRYVVDENRDFTLQDIEKKDFINEINSQFTLGSSNGDIWFKIELENEGDSKDFILYFTESFFEYVNIYEKKEQSYLMLSSNLFEYKEGTLNKNPIFNLTIDKNQKKVLFLQLHSKYQFFGEFKVYIDEELFHSDYMSYNILYGYFFGALFIIIGYTLFLFFRLKETIYLYYSAYIFTYMIFVFYFSGFARVYAIEEMYYYIGFIPALGIVFFMLFFSELLGLPKNYPRLHKVINIFVVFYVFLAILTTYDVAYFNLINTFGVLVYAYILGVIAFLLKQKVYKTLLYLLILLIYLVSMSMLTLMLDGHILNNDVSRYSFLFGSLLEIILFSSVLADRFRLIQEEKISIQMQLIEFKSSEQKRLEVEVEKRTQDVMELLKEKEVLLKEVYHRVKNNFQMVISMLGLESFSIEDVKQSERFNEIINRLKSISLVHEFLYKSDSLSQIQSKDYLLNIIEEIQQTYYKKKLEIQVDIQAHMIDMDQAIVIGMIANEVINNAIKHHDKDICCIKLSYVECDENIIMLQIQDDGPGFDASLAKNKQGMGLNLIKEFARKLPEVDVSFSSEKNTIFTLRYKPF